MGSLKLAGSDSLELDLRLARMRQLQIDLAECLAAVDRHRVELDRIRREIDALTRAIEDHQHR